MSGWDEYIDVPEEYEETSSVELLETLEKYERVLEKPKRGRPRILGPKTVLIKSRKLGCRLQIRRELSNLLREHMGKQGMSSKQLADLTEISEVSIIKILGGEGNPTFKTVGRLFHALNIQVTLVVKEGD